MTADVPPRADRGLLEALADELGLASRLLADLAFDLGTDEAVLRRHMGSLQAIDHVTQIQLTIATALRGMATDQDVIAGIGLEDVKQRILKLMDR